jgi:16S rRNA (guanine527-N7)-methyltransferase
MVGAHGPSLKFLFHVKHDAAPDEATEALVAAARTFGVELGADRAGALAVFERLLVERAVPLGMIAPSDAPRIRERHVLDCLRVVNAVRTDDRLCLDLGSGAGLPGLVVAIARPDVSLRLVERRRSRAAFLELAIERLGLRNTSVLPVRAEEVDEMADLCFARAFAPRRASWETARRLLRPGGRLVYFAGAGEREAPSPALSDGPSSVELLETPVLASSGPLVIMTR